MMKLNEIKNERANQESIHRAAIFSRREVDIREAYTYEQVLRGFQTKGTVKEVVTRTAKPRYPFNSRRADTATARVMVTPAAAAAAAGVYKVNEELGERNSAPQQPGRTQVTTKDFIRRGSPWSLTPKFVLRV